MNDLKTLYFDWLCDLISDGAPSESYHKLLTFLHNTEFIWMPQQPKDENRYQDGVDLRYRFGYDRQIRYQDIQDELSDDIPCSVLEMLAALALRCEEDLMSNEHYGNRTGYWFWEMIKNLGLINQTDDNFDILYVELAIDRFLTRSYRKNGEGGIVVLEHPPRDLRTVELWYQMMWYLSERIKKGQEEYD